MMKSRLKLLFATFLSTGLLCSTLHGAGPTTTALAGRVTVEFPSAPKKEVRTVDTKYGTIKFVSFKSRAPGVFLNLLITTFPASVIRSTKDPVAFMERTATGNEKQKHGAKRVYFRELKESNQWAAEHRFTYPSGKNSTGAHYAVGFAIHRYHLVDTSMVTVFVDVLDGMYQKQSEMIDKQIADFFSSLEI